MGDVFVERNQKTVADENYPLCSFIAHKGVVPKAKYDRSFLVKNDDKKYKRTELNDFIYSSNNLETGSIGLNKFGNATISPVYSVFMVNGNSEFIAGLATTHRFIYEMIRFRQGVVYGQWRIHESDFLKIKYYIPQVLEQEEIGNLLSELDRTITLHEEKKRQLERLKSALLQKMFANKSGYPAVRFNGFEKVWNERRIGDVLFKKSAKNTDLQFDKTDILSVSSMSDMETSREINSSESYMKTYNKLLVGELAFEGHSSAKYPFGRFVINNYRDGIVSHIYDVYKFKEDMNIHFVAEFFKQKKTMYYPLVNSTTAARMMNSLVAKDFYKQQIRFPTLEEQDQIGKLIKEIDFICIQHDRKIKLMKRVKRSLLQMMFI